MSRGTIKVERSDAIAWVTLSNPGKLNALALSMWRGLAETFAALESD